MVEKNCRNSTFKFDHVLNTNIQIWQMQGRLMEHLPDTVRRQGFAQIPTRTWFNCFYNRSCLKDNSYSGNVVVGVGHLVDYKMCETNYLSGTCFLYQQSFYLKENLFWQRLISILISSLYLQKPRHMSGNCLTKKSTTFFHLLPVQVCQSKKEEGELERDFSSWWLKFRQQSQWEAYLN